MESNIKGLVAAGHEMASELKAECGAVDMRSVAKLISDLATQLEVQLVRANALAEDQQKAIESIKQADSAVKLAHEKFSALAAENATLNDKMNRLLVWPGIEFYSSAWEFCNLDGNDALELMCDNKTPATDAFLAEVRAQGGAKALEDFAEFNIKSIDPFDDEYTEVLKETARAARCFAAQLRKGGNQ
ncbi:hypothetical protein [Escherichia marmotae]|uniref:hypothetical protein n=1 Tax=Escherichia marmotae TaxID=1499973 RepID=UPI0028158B16|nr:hypothetical protein [Escherichia marmotae]